MDKEKLENIARACGYEIFATSRNEMFIEEKGRSAWNPYESEADCFRMQEALVERYTFNDEWGFFVNKTETGYSVDSEIRVNSKGFQQYAEGKTLQEAWCNLAAAIGESMKDESKIV